MTIYVIHRHEEIEYNPDENTEIVIGVTDSQNKADTIIEKDKEFFLDKQFKEIWEDKDMNRPYLEKIITGKTGKKPFIYKYRIFYVTETFELNEYDKNIYHSSPNVYLK